MISVILSTNNEMRNHLLEQVLTVITQQDEPYEIIVVDNESTDGTQELCQKFGAQIYDLPDSNRAQRLNYGFHQAKGDIVLFHHPVSIIAPYSFGQIRHAIQS